MMKTSHFVVTMLMLGFASGEKGLKKRLQKRELSEGKGKSKSKDDGAGTYSWDYDDDYYADECDDYWYYNCPGSSPDEEEDICFSGNMEVFVQGKGAITMEALQVGDHVKVGEGYERVYGFAHRVPDKHTEFVQLQFNEGTPLEMSGEHLVFVDGKTNPVRADSIQVGDRLQANIDAVVQKVELVARNGIYSPLTSSGTIEVNGITASNYISFQKENNEYVEFQGGVEIMSSHDAAHIAMTPYRFYCTNLANCDANTAMPFYVSKGIELIKWSMKQHISVQWFVYASFRMLLLASILMASAVLMIPAYLLSGSSISQMERVMSHFSTVGASLNKGMKKEN